MKKFIIAAVAAATALVGTTAQAAPYGHDARGNDHRRQVEVVKVVKTPARAVPTRTVIVQKQWKRGERFETRRATNYRVIANPRAYRLQAAPRGYRWVQSGRDAVLVRVSNNLVAQVMLGIIR